MTKKNVYITSYNISSSWGKLPETDISTLNASITPTSYTPTALTISIGSFPETHKISTLSKDNFLSYTSF